MAGRKWMRTEPHDVYVIVDAKGKALYVGMSVNTDRRMLQHRQKPWFRDAIGAYIQTFRDWKEAKQAEGLAIRNLKPVHNNQQEAWSAAEAEANPPTPIASSERDLNG